MMLEIKDTSRNIKKAKSKGTLISDRKLGNMYHLLFEQANQGIVVYDVQTLKLYDINEKACSELGYTKEEFLKLNPNDFTIYKHPKQRTEFIQQLFEKGKLEFSIQHRSKDGKIFDRIVAASIIERGHKKYMVGIINDITCLKETETKLIKANKQIVKMNRKLEKDIKKAFQEKQEHYQYLLQKSKLESLGELAAGIAHEINQPLGILSLSFENLESKILSGNATPDYLETKFQSIDRNIKRIREIIEHVKIFSREQEMPALDKISVNQVINDALSLLKTQYNNHNIIILSDLKENIGFTVGSKNKLEQAVMNLLSNAKYAVEDKGVHFSENEYTKEIRIKTDSTEKKIHLSIEDNGIGIKKEKLNRIFDPFYTTKPEGIGTGLGLSIVYGIVKEMYGEIMVKSEENEFTRFEIFFPRFPERKQ